MNTISGYHEIQQPLARYRIVDHPALIELFNLRDITSLQQYHHEWVETQIVKEQSIRDPKWTESLAVGPESFTHNFRKQQPITTRYRSIEKLDDTYAIHEPLTSYSVYTAGSTLMAPISTSKSAESRCLMRTAALSVIVAWAEK